jgi:hypothetical protein
MPRNLSSSAQPAPFEPGQIKEAPTHLLASEKIEQFARESGFVERERKVRAAAGGSTTVVAPGTRPDSASGRYGMRGTESTTPTSRTSVRVFCPQRRSRASTACAGRSS